MGCITTLELEGIGLDCTDIPTGGIKEIHIANACDTVIGFHDKFELGVGGVNPDFGKVATLAFGAGEVFKLEFNKKDGVTGFTEVKTIDDTGLVTSVPTLTIEFPKMTKEKRNLINSVLNPNVTSLLFVRTAADTYHVLGAKFGMKATSGSGQTGTGRTEKNSFTLVFTGEESELSYDLTDKWGNVTGKVVPVSLGEGDWIGDLVANPDLNVPRQSCIPIPA